MTCKEVLSQLARSASYCGIPLKAGPVYSINAGIETPPELWAETPRLIARTGRTEGTKQYEVTLRMIETPDKNEATDKLDSIAGMEQTLTEVIDRLCAHDDMVKVDDIRFTPEENTLTNRGDISVKAVFNIITRY